MSLPNTADMCHGATFPHRRKPQPDGSCITCDIDGRIEAVLVDFGDANLDRVADRFEARR